MKASSDPNLVRRAVSKLWRRQKPWVHLACAALAESAEQDKIASQNKSKNKIGCKTLVRIKQDLLQRATFKTVSQIIENTQSSDSQTSHHHDLIFCQLLAICRIWCCWAPVIQPTILIPMTVPMSVKIPLEMKMKTVPIVKSLLLTRDATCKQQHC